MPRLLVPRADLTAAEQLVLDLLPGYRMGDPADAATRLGPLVSAAQRQRVLTMIDDAIAAGARRLGVPPALPPQGWFVAPTVLMDVRPQMAVAQEEVFGPVLAVMAYDDPAQGLEVANGTASGLSGAVWGPPTTQTVAVARRMRAGQVDVNGAPFNPAAPFGGFKQSGLGRENGRWGLESFLEPVAIQLPTDLCDIT